MQNDVKYMSSALNLAKKKGEYHVSPNPMVGCVIVKNNAVIGEGFHEVFGGSHAEINALKQAKGKTKGATAYVTLEPCCHHGKTPPCVESLVKSGIKKIFIAVKDPNPKMSGKSIQLLQQAGVEVNVGLCQKEAEKLNEIFFHYMKTKRPFVISKWAMSLDGKTITHEKDVREISGLKAFEQTHQLRAKVDAIMVGARTVLNDNPTLTCRLKNFQFRKQPTRIIIMNGNKMDEWDKSLNIFSTDAPTKIISSKDGRVDLRQLLIDLGKEDISSVLVEGGMNLHHSFFRENLVNKVQVTVSPVIIGDLEKKHVLKNVEIENLSPDYGFVGEY